MKNKSCGRKVFSIMIVCLTLLFCSVNTFGQNNHANPNNNGWGKASDNGDNHASNNGNSHGVGHQKKVGAPLDGGIISVLLAGAGVAYFTKRKKGLNA